MATLHRNDHRTTDSGEHIHFNLRIGLDEDEKNDGNYDCHIKITDSEGNILGKYFRVFPKSKFNKIHYERFIRKFTNDIGYREKFRVQ